MLKLKLLILMIFTSTSHLCAAKAPTSDEVEAAERYFTSSISMKLWRASINDKDAIDRFFETLEGNHVVEPLSSKPESVVVTYFVRGSNETDYMMLSGGPDFFGLRFKKFAQSSIYFCVQTIPIDASFNFGINEFKIQYMPNNIIEQSMDHIVDGVVIAPDAPKSEFLTESKENLYLPMKETRIKSKALKESWPVNLYVPRDLDHSKPIKLLIQLDGENFNKPFNSSKPWEAWTPLPTIVNNLALKNRIAQTILVLVPNQGQRSTILLKDSFSDFLALELPANILKKLNVKSFDGVYISGPSRAGYTAINTAYRHSDIIAGVLSQSGSFYYTFDESDANWPIYPKYEGHLLEQIKSKKFTQQRFYLDVGLYDLGAARVGANRQLKDILKFNGAKVKYNEYNGGHSHLNWRQQISTGLIFLLKPNSTTN